MQKYEANPCVRYKFNNIIINQMQKCEASPRELMWNRRTYAQHDTAKRQRHRAIDQQFERINRALYKSERDMAEILRHFLQPTS